MRIAVIHLSIHHQNTQRVAQAMASAIDAQLLTIAQAQELGDDPWDLVGLGSGIFFGKHHAQLLEFAARWPNLPSNCFVFSTAGLRFLYPLWHRPLIKVLRHRGCRVRGQFCSPGWDTVGPLRAVGGIHRGRPNATDLERAAAFARSIVAKEQGN